MDQLISEPGELRRAVIEYDVLRRTIETDTGECRPVIRIRQVEVCTGALDTLAVSLLDQAQAERTGQHRPDPLPTGD